MKFPVTSQRMRLRGLGDLVAVVADPIKRAGIRIAPPPIRRIIENCNCEGRKATLNRLVPF